MYKQRWRVLTWSRTRPSLSLNWRCLDDFMRTKETNIFHQTRREGSAVCMSAGSAAEDPEAHRGGGSGPGSEVEGQTGQFELFL